jgi:GNAT superfamily N-acetyltransferase
MLPINQWVDIFNNNVRIKVFAHEGGSQAPSPENLSVVRQENFPDDKALRSTMEENRGWETAEIARRRALGDVCYMVFDGPRCVHYSWVSQRLLYISELGYQAELREQNFWIYDSYTSPSHRGRKIFPRLLLRLEEIDLARRCGILWAGVQDDNAPSLNAISKAGFREAFVLEKTILFPSKKAVRSRRVLNNRLTERFDLLPSTWTIE